MLVGIVGSRDYPNMHKVREFVMSLADTDVVVSGGARGVDTVAVATAKVWGLATYEFLADWDTHGKSAGFIRNGAIAETVDRLAAFWDGESRGTADTIAKFEARGLKAEVYLP